MSSKPVIRQATAFDAQRFYDGPPPFSFTGYSIVLDDEIVALFGICYQEGKPAAFSDMKPALRPFKKTIVKACRIMAESINKTGGPVYAIASDTEPTAPYLLAKLGFKPTGMFGPHGETLVRY